jgi:hypothetical protein
MSSQPWGSRRLPADVQPGSTIKVVHVVLYRAFVAAVMWEWELWSAKNPMDPPACR